MSTVYLYPEDIPTESCDKHEYVSFDTSTKMLATPYCPPSVIKTISMVDYKRDFRIPGVVINDQQYMLNFNIPEIPSQGATTATRYPAIPGITNNGTAYNHFCTIHKAPEYPDEPNDPNIPNNSEE